MPGSGRDTSPPPLSLVADLPNTPDVLLPSGSEPAATSAPPASSPVSPADRSDRSDRSSPAPPAPEQPAEAAEHSAAAAFAVWTLADGVRSPTIAREYTRSALRGWDLDELIDSIAVAVSEMVTNAMCHTPSPEEVPGAQPVLLSLAKQDRSVLCVVVDPGCRAPEVRALDDNAESGRGLHIVESLSNEWGWTVPGPAGKAVWASFSSADSNAHEYCQRARGQALSRVLLLAGILGGTEAGPSEPHAVHAQRVRHHD